MTDELQNAESTNDEAKPNEGAELATATDEKQDKTEDSNQDAVNKAINKQHAKFREQERRADKLERERDEANKKLTEFESKKEKVTIPNLPDSYDEDFEEKLRLRDEAIRLKATQDANEQYATEQQEAKSKATAETETKRVQGLIQSYTSNISTLGLSAEEIRIAGDTVAANGIDSQVAEYILADKDGPLITKYLSNNPIVQDELRGLTTIEAAMKIDSVIRQSAIAGKTQASTTPDPTEILSGGGSAESDGGITYE